MRPRTVSRYGGGGHNNKGSTTKLIHPFFHPPPYRNAPRWQAPAHMCEYLSVPFQTGPTVQPPRFNRRPTGVHTSRYFTRDHIEQEQKKPFPPLAKPMTASFALRVRIFRQALLSFVLFHPPFFPPQKKREFLAPAPFFSGNPWFRKKNYTGDLTPSNSSVVALVGL